MRRSDRLNAQSVNVGRQQVAKAGGLEILVDFFRAAGTEEVAHHFTGGVNHEAECGQRERRDKLHHRATRTPHMRSHASQLNQRNERRCCGAKCPLRDRELFMYDPVSAVQPAAVIADAPPRTQLRDVAMTDDRSRLDRESMSTLTDARVEEMLDDEQVAKLIEQINENRPLVTRVVGREQAHLPRIRGMRPRSPMEREAGTARDRARIAVHHRRTDCGPVLLVRRDQPLRPLRLRQAVILGESDDRRGRRPDACDLAADVRVVVRCLYDQRAA